MKITVCIGSSCHLKGSRKVVELLQDLPCAGDHRIRHNIEDKVELGGTFCLGNCQKAVCVTVDGELFSVSPDTVNQFFNDNVLAKV